MKRLMVVCVLGLVIVALLLTPALGGPVVEAKKGKTGPGYSSPPLCCTEAQCKGGPGGWNKAPAPAGLLVRVGPVTGPRSGK